MYTCRVRCSAHAQASTPHMYTSTGQIQKCSSKWGSRGAQVETIQSTLHSKAPSLHYISQNSSLPKKCAKCWNCVQSVDDSVPLVCRTNGSAPVNWLCPAYPVLLNITLQIFYTNKQAIVDYEIFIFWKRICEQKFLLPSNSVGLKVPTKRLSLCRRIIDYVYFTAQ